MLGCLDAGIGCVFPPACVVGSGVGVVLASVRLRTGSRSRSASLAGLQRAAKKRGAGCGRRRSKATERSQRATARGSGWSTRRQMPNAKCANGSAVGWRALKFVAWSGTRDLHAPGYAKPGDDPSSHWDSAVSGPALQAFESGTFWFPSLLLCRGHPWQPDYLTLGATHPAGVRHHHNWLRGSTVRLRQDSASGRPAAAGRPVASGRPPASAEIRSRSPLS